MFRLYTISGLYIHTYMMNGQSTTKCMCVWACLLLFAWQCCACAYAPDIRLLTISVWLISCWLALRLTLLVTALISFKFCYFYGALCAPTATPACLAKFSIWFCGCSRVYLMASYKSCSLTVAVVVLQFFCFCHTTVRLSGEQHKIISRAAAKAMSQIYAATTIYTEVSLSRS